MTNLWQVYLTAKPKLYSTENASHCALVSIWKNHLLLPKNTSNTTLHQKNDKPIFLELLDMSG